MTSGQQVSAWTDLEVGVQVLAFAVDLVFVLFLDLEQVLVVDGQRVVAVNDLAYLLELVGIFHALRRGGKCSEMTLRSATAGTSCLSHLFEVSVELAVLLHAVLELFFSNDQLLDLVLQALDLLLFRFLQLAFVLGLFDSSGQLAIVFLRTT